MIASARKTRARNLRTELLARACFPASRYDGEKFLELLIDDAGRQRSKDYRESELLAAAKQIGRKRSSRGASSGLVLVCASYLLELGQRVSLETCSRLASELSYLANDYAVVTSGGKILRLQRMNADHASIKSIFREYRTVAHVWAAELCVEKPLREGLTEWSGKLIQTYVRTAFRFQQISEELATSEIPGILRVEEACAGFRREGRVWTHSDGPLRQLDQAFRTVHTEGGVFHLPQSQ